MLRGLRESASLNQNQPEVYTRLREVGIERNRFLKWPARGFRIAKAVIRFSKRILRLGGIGPQPNPFVKLLDRFRSLALLHQHTPEQKASIGVAWVGFNDVVQYANRLRALAFREQTPCRFNWSARLLREQQAGAPKRGQPSHHDLNFCTRVMPAPSVTWISRSAATRVNFSICPSGQRISTSTVAAVPSPKCSRLSFTD